MSQIESMSGFRDESESLSICLVTPQIVSFRRQKEALKEDDYIRQVAVNECRRDKHFVTNFQPKFRYRRCRICDPAVLCDLDLDRHVWDIHHYDESSYKHTFIFSQLTSTHDVCCDYCGKCFSDREKIQQLPEHIKHCKYAKDTPFQCQLPVCDFQTLDFHCFRRHSLVEHGCYVTFQCKMCGFDQADSTKSITYYDMQQHVTLEHFRVNCDDSTLQDFNEVIKHTLHFYQIEFDEKPSIFCEDCSSSFKSNASLQDHIFEAMARSETRIECLRGCSERFKTFQVLENHVLKVHEKCLIFHCKLCPAKFAEVSWLKKHIMVQHSRFVEISPPDSINFIRLRESNPAALEHCCAAAGDPFPPKMDKCHAK